MACVFKSNRSVGKVKPMQSLFTLPLAGSFGELVLIGRMPCAGLREGKGEVEFVGCHKGTPLFVCGNNNRCFVLPTVPSFNKAKPRSVGPSQLTAKKTRINPSQRTMIWSKNVSH